MKKYLIIYHKEDNDGVFSGAILYDYIINRLNYKDDDVDTFGADYNILEEFANNNDMETLKEQYESIIMTDISFKDYYMKELYETYGNKFLWFDHHAPIIKASEVMNFGKAQGIRNTSKSAILCAYEFLYDQFNTEKIPEVFLILSAWDSWTYEQVGFDFDYVRDVNKGFTITYKLNFGSIYEIVHQLVLMYINPNGTRPFSEDQLIKEMRKTGKTINEYEDNTMADIIKNSGDTSWKVIINDEIGKPLARTACAIFHQGATNSTMFKCLRKTDIQHGLVFKHQVNGNWVLSMYNINDDCDFHCGEFLKENYNGGGHKGAAGCTLTEKQFIEILINKII